MLHVSSMHSSTKIINNETNFLSDEVKEYLEDIDKDNLKNKYLSFLKKRLNKRILVIGEPIIDVYNYVQIQGKSSKNNILSSKHLNTSSFGGGTILVTNVLKEFMNKIDFVWGPISNSWDTFDRSRALKSLAILDPLKLQQL